MTLARRIRLLEDRLVEIDAWSVLQRSARRAYQMGVEDCLPCPASPSWRRVPQDVFNRIFPGRSLDSPGSLALDVRPDPERLRLKRHVVSTVISCGRAHGWEAHGDPRWPDWHDRFWRGIEDLRELCKPRRGRAR